MDLVEHVENFLTDHFPDEDDYHFLLAVSGGIDSMVLLDIFHRIATKQLFKCRLSVAHVNHSLHHLSQETEKLVRDWSNHLGHQYIGMSFTSEVDLENNSVGTEAGARSLRYSLLFDTANQINSDALFTAHHFNDQIETVLLNIGRGTGLYGLKGMKPNTSSTNMKLCRPLLTVRKETLKNYADERKIPYVTDPTNSDSSFARNRLRNKILPEWELAQPSPKKNIEKLSKQAQRENVFWANYLEDNFNDWEWKDEIQIDLERYRNQPEAAQFRYLREIPSKLKGSSFGWAQQNFRDIHDLFLHSQSGKMIHLPGDAFALKEYERGVISTKTIQFDYSLKVDKTSFPTSIEDLGTLRISEPANFCDEENMLRSSCSLQSLEGCSIHPWKPGEFELYSNSRTIKQIFDTNRVPYRARRNIPLLVRNNTVHVIPGYFPTEGEHKDEKHRVVGFLPSNPMFHQISKINLNQ